MTKMPKTWKIPKYPQPPPAIVRDPGNEHLGAAVMCLAVIGFAAIVIPLLFALLN